MSKSRKHGKSHSRKHHSRKSKRSYSNSATSSVKNVANTAEKGIGSVYGTVSSLFNLGTKSVKSVSKDIGKFGKSKRRRRH